MKQDYLSIWQRSLEHPQAFWAEAAAGLDWHKKPQTILDDSESPFTRWYPDGELNVCHNALDRHLDAGRGDHPALIYDSPMTDSQRSYSFREARDAVAAIAGALRARGVEKGDRVVIYMPMIPEAVFAMLACARIGAIHSVVFGGFASAELASRITDAEPAALLTASCGLEPNRIVPYKPLVDGALEISGWQPPVIMVLQRPQQPCELRPGRDLDWHDELGRWPTADCVPVAANDPLYILYTSGTTGQPKGVVHDSGGTAVSHHWSMKNIYGVEPGEVFWAASDIGWIVGHSYIVYSPLLHGNTTVLYEGKPVGTPDATAFWRVLRDHRVTTLFTAPTAIRAIKREDPEGKLVDSYDLSSFRRLFLAGERSDPDTIFWSERVLKVPVIDHWWQTETSWTICGICTGIDDSAPVIGAAGRPVPGYRLRSLAADGKANPPGEIGALVVDLPLPPGTFTTLWNNPDRFVSSYFSRFQGCYETGDAGYLDENGFVYVMARTDDVINVAGHRLSTSGFEEVLTEHPDIAEAAVVGVADDLKGQLPCGFVVLNAKCDRPQEEITAECIQRVRDRIGPVAAFRLVAVVPRLPKTRSGKILRSTMAKIADGNFEKVPATIDDPKILDEIGAALSTLGYPRAEIGN